MAHLHLRNCMDEQISYWRDAPFTSKNYVAPGREGRYKYSIPWVMAVQREKKPHGKTNRYVDNSGTYYAYWSDDKVKILDEKQIKQVETNEANPYRDEWIDPPEAQDYNFDVSWFLIASRKNDLPDTSDKVTYTKTVGLEVSHSDTKKLTVSQSNTKGVEVGAEFKIKGIGISGKIKDETTSKTENFHETMDEMSIYESTTETQEIILEPHRSVAVWQVKINIWGNVVALNYIELRAVGDSVPTSPAFDPAVVTAVVFK